MARSALWTVEPGRHIHFDGQPFVHIDREQEALPVEADNLTHFIVEALNNAGMTPDELYKRAMGVVPRRSKHSGHEARAERKYSMTYGELPPFEQFKRDVGTRVDPDSSDSNVYWPAGTLYPMELVGAHEVQLANDFGGLEQFETERRRSGRNSGAIGFKGDEHAIYGFLEYLVEEWGNGDEEAGDLASSIMTTLGYEWI